MPTSTLGNAIGNLLPSELYPIAVEKVFYPDIMKYPPFQY